MGAIGVCVALAAAFQVSDLIAQRLLSTVLLSASSAHRRYGPHAAVRGAQPWGAQRDRRTLREADRGAGCGERTKARKCDEEHACGRVGTSSAGRLLGIAVAHLHQP